MYKFNKIFRRKTGENVCDLGLVKEFLYMTTKAQYIKEKNDQLDLIKMQIFCSSKDTIKKTDRQIIYWEKIYPKYIYVKELIFK